MPGGDASPSLLKGSVEKVGGNTTQFNRSLLSTLNKLPVISPPPSPPLPLSNSYHAVLKEAQKLQKEQNDQFVAIDHLLLAIMKVDNSGFAELAKAAGITIKLLDAEIRRKRGGRKVDSKSAESQFEALAKCKSCHTLCPTIANRRRLYRFDSFGRTRKARPSHWKR